MHENNVVYLVWHTHKIDKDNEDEKLIGVYSTMNSAQKAVEKTSLLEGFKDCIEGFEICDYELDKDHWTEGYVTIYHDEE